MYSTCPNTCPLKPAADSGSTEVDLEYLAALLDAVPEDGCGWTYSHFGPDLIPKPAPGKTTINLSADSYDQAVGYISSGYPTVVTVQKEFSSKVDRYKGVRFVRCPAEYNDAVTCSNCGGKNDPLCAQSGRNFVVKFTAHGTKHKLVGSDTNGGCYGSSGPVAIHWKKTSEVAVTGSDVDLLTNWIKTLPKGTKIRHHVVGDLGME